jgi:hypothetical protein
MAKKRKKQKRAEEEEKYEFVPPEFDEKQFLKDEMSATKQVLIIVAYGALMGILAAMATILTTNGITGLAVLVVGFGTIKFLFNALRFDLSKFTKKTWLGHGAWFFFTFLAIWILLINPPFTDFASPEVKNVKLAVTVQETNVTNVIHYNYTFNYTSNLWEWHTGKHNMSVTDALKDAYANGAQVILAAHIADNDRLVGLPTIIFQPDNPSVTPKSMSEAASFSYYYDISVFGVSYLKDGQYFTFQINAEDPANHITVFRMADYSIGPIVG